MPNTKTLNTIEGGTEITENMPFLVVTPKEKNQVMNLVEEKNASQKIILDNINKSLGKLKLPAELNYTSIVSGNIVITTANDKNGNALVKFDTDKKTGNVKLITDLRTKK